MPYENWCAISFFSIGYHEVCDTEIVYLLGHKNPNYQPIPLYPICTQEPKGAGNEALFHLKICCINLRHTV